MRPCPRSEMWDQLVVFKFVSLKQPILKTEYYSTQLYLLKAVTQSCNIPSSSPTEHYYKSLSFWSRIIQTVPPLFPKSPICSIKSTFTLSLSLSLSLQNDLISSRQNVSHYFSHSPQLPSCLGLSGQIKVPRRWCGVVWCGVSVFLLISVGTWS